MDRLLDRLYNAIIELGLGVPVSLLRGDMLKAANMAAGRVGTPRLGSLEDEPSLRRVVLALEGEVDE